MKLSNSFMITRREYPNDEKTLSSKLLVQSGMIMKNNSGIYSYLPLGLKVLKNIKKVIRDEVNKIGACEVLLPTLINDNNNDFESKNRVLDDEIYRLINRNKKEMILCPTSEELFTHIASMKIQSYKDLHFSLYQIEKKYRDEKRLEYGLIRKNEFYLFDSYSFDAGISAMEVSYDKMYLAFKNIFNTLSINTITSSAFSSLINGITSEEFHVKSTYGDRKIVKCTNCTYTSSLEDANNKSISSVRETMIKKKELVNVDNAKSIKELSEKLNVFESNILKSLICKVDDIYKVILLKGNSKLNIKKLKELFNTPNVTIPDEEELHKLNIHYDSVSPVDCDFEIIADNEVKSMRNFVCKSNESGKVFINVNFPNDFKISRFADLKLFDNNSVCPKCKNKCEIIDCIEVGEITKLSDIYSKAYNLTYVDESNNEEYVYMGMYQIGIDRCLAAVVEENHDDKGIIWPLSIAPYKVIIIVTNVNDKDSLKFANALYDKLNNLGIETMLDDRKDSVGVKFNDADLIGIPLRITVGKKLYTDSSVELKLRNENESKNIKINEIIKTIQNIIDIDK